MAPLQAQPELGRTMAERVWRNVRVNQVAWLVGWAIGLGVGSITAFAEGILDAPCPPGAKQIITDYQGSGTSEGRGHDMAGFLRGKNVNGSGTDTEYMLLVWARDS